MLANDPPVQTIDTASSVLVSAADTAPAAAFERIVRPLIEDGQLAAVLYERSGTSFVEDLARSGAECPDDVRVLDVGETLRSTSRAADHEDPSSTTIVGNVAHVDDVTRVERELERYLEEWAPSPGPSILYVDSLSPLLGTVDAPLVGDFLERLTRTLRRWDALGVVQVETARHDERTVSGLGHRVDATIELAGEEDDVEYSVVDPGAASWVATTAGTDRPPVDVALDLLRTPERRAVLAYLSIAGTSTLENLARYLAERPDVAETDPENLQVSLYQVHLPKLIDAGALTREDGHRVELGPPGDALVALLAVVSAFDRR